ncbi:MAG: hypothetical protein QOC96_1967 [Acidobacteriota bacterium]|nr:hypothetical protein [Acidobacteriota bacterium]
MNKKSFASLLALVVALMSFVATARAQTKTATATAAPASSGSPLNMLPPSDFVVAVNVKRWINEGVPKFFANDPAKLAEFNAQIDKLKTQTGLDLRSFEEIAVGMHYLHPSPNVTKADTVVLAHGTFNAGLLLAAGRMAAQGKYHDEKYNGATIYIYSLNSQMNLHGLFNMKINDLAVTSLDANTLAIGDLESVRATIDANKMPGHVNNDLIQLATRAPNALLGFSANVPPSLTASADLGNPEITKMVGSIHQAYGALSTTADGFGLLAAARTENPDQAKALSDTLAALKQFGGMVVSQLPPETGKIAQNVLDSLKITASGNETLLSLEVRQADITTLMRAMQPKGKQESGARSQNPE